MCDTHNHIVSLDVYIKGGVWLELENGWLRTWREQT